MKSPSWRSPHGPCRNTSGGPSPCTSTCVSTLSCQSRSLRSCACAMPPPLSTGLLLGAAQHAQRLLAETGVHELGGVDARGDEAVPQVELLFVGEAVPAHAAVHLGARERAADLLVHRRVLERAVLHHDRDDLVAVA